MKLILDKFIGEVGAGENLLKKGKVAGVDWDKMQPFFQWLILQFLLMELLILPLQNKLGQSFKIKGENNGNSEKIVYG